MKRFMVLVCCTFWLAACAAPASTPRERYVNDLTFIAQAPRSPDNPHHQEVQDLCAQRLTELGYAVERQNIMAGANVIGRLPGQTRPDEVFIVSAHYDSIGNCKGADDNGTGVAALLELARELAQEKHARTLVVACWDAEEEGLRGSEAYVEQARAQNTRIVGSLVYDMIGYTDSAPNSQQMPLELEAADPRLAGWAKQTDGQANFITLLYDKSFSPFADQFAQSLQSANVPVLPFAVDLNGPIQSFLTRSDHYPFWQAGYPAMQVTDTGQLRTERYHCMSGEDEMSVLNHDFATNIVTTSVTAVRQALNP